MNPGKLVLDNPCDKSWNQMPEADSGRYCASCDKIVIDFSTKSKEETVEFFQNLGKEKVCGYFRAEMIQLNRPKIHQVLIDLYQQVESNFKSFYFKKTILAILSFSLFMVGCKNKNVGEVNEIDMKSNQQEGIRVGKHGTKMDFSEADKQKLRESQRDHEFLMGFPPPVYVESHINEPKVTVDTTKIIQEPKNDSTSLINSNE